MWPPPSSWSGRERSAEHDQASSRRTSSPAGRRPGVELERVSMRVISRCTSGTRAARWASTPLAIRHSSRTSARHAARPGTRPTGRFHQRPRLTTATRSQTAAKRVSGASGDAVAGSKPASTIGQRGRQAPTVTLASGSRSRRSTSRWIRSVVSSASAFCSSSAEVISRRPPSALCGVQSRKVNRSFGVLSFPGGGSDSTGQAVSGSPNTARPWMQTRQMANTPSAHHGCAPPTSDRAPIAPRHAATRPITRP